MEVYLDNKKVSDSDYIKKIVRKKNIKTIITVNLKVELIEKIVKNNNSQSIYVITNSTCTESIKTRYSTVIKDNDEDTFFRVINTLLIQKRISKESREVLIVINSENDNSKVVTMLKHFNLKSLLLEL